LHLGGGQALAAAARFILRKIGEWAGLGLQRTEALHEFHSKWRGEAVTIGDELQESRTVELTLTGGNLDPRLRVLRSQPASQDRIPGRTNLLWSAHVKLGMRQRRPTGPLDIPAAVMLCTISKMISSVPLSIKIWATLV
jgi:hypothetical protein